jgi:predicted nucleic acid-binding protein
MKQRIYIDTSVIGGCEDREFEEWSRKLFSEFSEGLRVAVVSDLTLRELENAPVSVRQLIDAIPPTAVERVTLSEEAEELARLYLEEGVVSTRHLVDAQHIAIATIERVDVLVSWNFKQVVNLRRIQAFNAVNLKSGHPMLEIRSPREVVHEEGV